MARLSPSERKTLRQFSLSPIVHEFLDTLERGEMSSFIEGLIVASPEYVEWESEKEGAEKAQKEA